MSEEMFIICWFIGGFLIILVGMIVIAKFKGKLVSRLVKEELKIGTDFEKELASLINRYCLENGSDTPDFILAKYLKKCLLVFNDTVLERCMWYKIDHSKEDRKEE